MEALDFSMPPFITKSKGANKRAEQSMFKVDNITIARPALLKIFYWQCLDIENLNKQLLSQGQFLEHHLEFPTQLLNSTPLKIVFWLRNLSDFEYTMIWKRVQNCKCVPKETRVGFNQYRNLYHCPHRRLINISQENVVMKPHEIVAVPVVACYYILGSYTLSYELRVSDGRIILLHFHINIAMFDVGKSILNTKMIPVNIKEHRKMPQPLWIRNITMQSINFSFSSKIQGLSIINRNMAIPPQCVWPLIVEYIPSDFENNLELFVTYRETACNTRNHYKIPITCSGFIEDKLEPYTVPNFDYECSDYLHVLYPNRLEFTMEINEERTLMVAVHNYNQHGMEFRWQTCAINQYFSFTFEPTTFTLKPHHSKLCVVHAKSCKKSLHFKYIPGILEVHRILEKSTKIARELLDEVESIDDPKWKENSYVEHVLLHIDLKVNFPKLQRINVKQQYDESVALESKAETANGMRDYTTIFEKLFWEHLSKSDHMRNTSKISRHLTYQQVLNRETAPKKKDSCAIIDKQEAFNILSSLTAEACRDISKNYRFIPPEVLDTN